VCGGGGGGGMDIVVAQVPRMARGSWGGCVDIFSIFGLPGTKNGGLSTTGELGYSRSMRHLATNVFNSHCPSVESHLSFYKNHY